MRTSSEVVMSLASERSIANSVPAPTMTNRATKVTSRRLRSELRRPPRISGGAAGEAIRAHRALPPRAVAKAVHGLDHIGGRPQADPQAAHVHVDGARVDIAAHLPDLLEQLLAREHPTRVADQKM